MRKYPVVSKSGEEYEVIIDANASYLFRDHDVFLRQKCPGVLRKNRTIQLRSGVYREEKWGFDFEAMAKDIVREYEEAVQQQLIRIENRRVGIESFEQWDGIIKDGE